MTPRQGQARKVVLDKTLSGECGALWTGALRRTGSLRTCTGRAAPACGAQCSPTPKGRRSYKTEASGATCAPRENTPRDGLPALFVCPHVGCRVHRWARTFLEMPTYCTLPSLSYIAYTPGWEDSNGAMPGLQWDHTAAGRENSHVLQPPQR